MMTSSPSPVIHASVVLLNYNSYDDVQELLEKCQVRRHDGIVLNFILVDNASPHPAGKSEALKAMKEEDIFIQNQENNGYACGNNIGLRKALEEGAQYAFVVNPDIGFEDELIYFKMIREARQLGEDFLMCGPVVKGVPPFTLRPKVKELVFPRKFRRKVVEYYQSVKHQSIIPAYRIYGCFILIDLAAFAQIGLFDEGTFLYIEEAIVAEKAIRSGKKIYILNDFEVEHFASKSVNESFRFKKYQFLSESTFRYLHKYREVNKISAFFISGIIYLSAFYATTSNASGFPSKRHKLFLKDKNVLKKDTWYFFPVPRIVFQ